MSAIYEVTVRGTYNGKDWINVFGYALPAPLATPTALELLTLMGFIPEGDPLDYPADTLFSAWLAAVSESVFFVEVEARELYSLTDFYLAPFLPGTHGGTEGTPMSPFNAYGLQSNRKRTDIRRGMKRFVGVVEEQVVSMGVLSSPQLSSVQLIGDKMTEELAGVAAVYSPCIISREKIVTVGEPDEYRLYETREEQLEHIAVPVSWTAYTDVRTQNSRKD